MAVELFERWRASGREVAVVGLGKSGTAASRLLRRHGLPVYASDSASGPAYEAWAAELRAIGAEVQLGGHDLDRVARAAAVVVAPGVPPDVPPLEAARRAGVDVYAEVDIGFLALGAALGLQLLFPTSTQGADRRIVWGVVLLICGVVTYVTALQRYGTVDAIGDSIADLDTPLLVAFLLCAVGAVTSAVASSAAILGALIPLAVPFLVQGELGVSAVVVALAVSATVVDCTPFSTVGALVLANTDEGDRPRVYRTMIGWGALMVVSAPIVTFLVFILPFS